MPAVMVGAAGNELEEDEIGQHGEWAAKQGKPPPQDRPASPTDDAKEYRQLQQRRDDGGCSNGGVHAAHERAERADQHCIG